MTDLVDQLATATLIGAVPREELAWLVEHGTVRHLIAGAFLSTKGAQVDSLHIVLEAHLAVFVDRAAGRHKITEYRAGRVTGLLPYSRLVNSPVDSIAVAPTTILEIHRTDPPGDDSALSRAHVDSRPRDAGSRA